MTKKLEKLSNCTVHLEGRKHSITGNTDEEGNIKFTEVLPDVYTMVITRDGYKEYTHPEPIEIVKGKLNQKLLNITMEEETQPQETSRDLKIKITPPAEGVQLTITDITDPEKPVKDKTVYTPDMEGIIKIEQVPFGVHTLDVTCEGYMPYTQNITVNKNNNNPRNIAISLTETTETTDETGETTDGEENPA